jgi:hypothetical protein
MAGNKNGGFHNPPKPTCLELAWSFWDNSRRFFIGLLSPTRLQGEFFAKLAGVAGMLVRLHGQLVSSEMISFTVRGCRGRVGMGGKVMELGDSIVRALWHGLLLVPSMFESSHQIGSRAKAAIWAKSSTMAGLAMSNPIQHQPVDHVILHEE